MISDKNLQESFSAHMALGREFREHGISASHEVKHYVCGWIETHDPIYIDELVLHCNENDVPITATLRKYMAASAKHRLAKHRSSRAKQKLLKYYAYSMMAERIYSGDTMPQAAGHAAVVFQELAKGRNQIKASTFHKLCPSEFRATGQEKRLFEYFDLVDRGDHKSGDLLEPDEELKGERR